MTNGDIAPNNVNILLEVAKLSNLKKAEDLVVQYIKDNNAENTDTEKVSSHRKQMFKTLQNASPDALKRIIGHYDLAMYEYTNIWDVVFRLETDKLLSDEQNKRNIFISLLQQSDDNVTSNRKRARQGNSGDEDDGASGSKHKQKNIFKNFYT
ncbi:uncharacterized protein [Antedon mediterranea]|uniref:uncharacterized protein n=1 Tax=Antedon mediterranea TaxID=105859 RepID=UPI003AF497B8